MSLYGAGPRPGRWSTRRRRDDSCAAWPTTRSSATCWCCTTCTPTTCDTRVQAGARPGPPLPRLARGRRRAARASTSDGVVAPPARGQLRRLPVVGADGARAPSRTRSCVAAPDVVAVEAEGMVEPDGPALLQIQPFQLARAGRPPSATPVTAGSTSSSTCRRARCRRCTLGDAQTRRRQPRRHPGRLPRPLPGLRRRALATASLAGDVLTCACAARATTSGGPAAPSTTTGGSPTGPRCRSCRSTGAGRSRVPQGAVGMTGPTRCGSARSAGSRRRSRRRSRSERCEFCAADIGERHGHVADVADHRLLCVCRPCYLLFAPQGAGGGRYRGVGEEVRRVGDLLLDDARWDALRIPVDLVFFFRQTDADAPARVLPRPRRRDRVASSTCPPGATSAAANPVLDEPSTTSRRCCCAGTTSTLLLLPGADRRLLRAGRRGPAARGPGSAAGPEVWRGSSAFFAGLDDRASVVPRAVGSPRTR